MKPLNHQLQFQRNKMTTNKKPLKEYSGKCLPPVGDSLVGGEAQNIFKRAAKGNASRAELGWAKAKTKFNIKHRLGSHPKPNLPEGEVSEQVRAYAVNNRGETVRPSNNTERTKLAKTVSMARANKRNLNKAFDQRMYPTSGVESGNASGLIAGGRGRAIVKKYDQEKPMSEDWGSSDTTAAMKVMWNVINKEFDGHLSIESIESAAAQAAEMYYDSLGVSIEDAKNVFIGHFLRRRDGVMNKSDPVIENENQPHEVFFKLTSQRANLIMQDMREDDLLPTLSFHGDVISASSDDVAVLRNKLIQAGQIDAFEEVMD
jgi:hypothetical protein